MTRAADVVCNAVKCFGESAKIVRNNKKCDPFGVTETEIVWEGMVLASSRKKTEKNGACSENETLKLLFCPLDAVAVLLGDTIDLNGRHYTVETIKTQDFASGTWLQVGGVG